MNAADVLQIYVFYVTFLDFKICYSGKDFRFFFNGKLDRSNQTRFVGTTVHHNRLIFRTRLVPTTFTQIIHFPNVCRYFLRIRMMTCKQKCMCIFKRHKEWWRKIPFKINLWQIALLLYCANLQLSSSRQNFKVHVATCIQCDFKFHI